MQIVIDIPEWLYDSISEYPSRGFAVSQLERAIIHGTVLTECEDAIRKAVLKLIENKPYDWSNLTERHEMLQDIRKMPSVTSSRHKGHWIDREEYDADRWKCSECGQTEQYQENFCPNCGVKMESEE